MNKTLNTGVNNAKNVQRYMFSEGALCELPDLIKEKRQNNIDFVLYFIDVFFKSEKKLVEYIKDYANASDKVVFVETSEEPSTEYINSLVSVYRKCSHNPCAVVAIGGGITMDVAKAVSNLLTNSGKAEDYQGWDLITVPGIYKIGIPTLSGTGAEATRTCVMTNKKSGLKLGMNSDHTVFDQIILDPLLTRTVPRNQYFYTGMDAYIHCVESLGGQYRNAIGDAYSDQTIRLCREVFNSNNMMSDDNRSKLMVASYLGGCAIATSYVGVVHPFSAGLSVVLGIHHCEANCIAMRAMEEFYPKEYSEFWSMVEKQDITIPDGICRDLDNEQYEQLYAATVIHEKPLTNALGEEFKDILTKEKVIDLFKKM